MKQLFDCRQKVYPAHSTAIVQLISVDGPLLDGIHLVTVAAMEAHDVFVAEVQAQRGVLELEITFKKEQEYRIAAGEQQWSVYCVESDLYERMPLKGDLHMHSNRSDGMESPAYVAAAARSLGMDFLAMTDHLKYAPSLEVLEVYKDFETELLLFPGEEIHPPNNPIHIINFGGRFSINELLDEQYVNEVSVLATRKEVPAGVNAYIAASCEWCYGKIEEAGGISLLCHPLWIENGRYNVNTATVDYLIGRRRFTALELLGGHAVESNNLQTALYNQKRIEGCRLPIVGVSDAHGFSEEAFFGWAHTVVFVKSRDLKGIKEGIESLYSVAVETKTGEAPRVYGDYRLVKYVLFLMREVFPAHDAACKIEASTMFKYIENKSKKEVFNHEKAM